MSADIRETIVTPADTSGAAVVQLQISACRYLPKMRPFG